MMCPHCKAQLGKVNGQGTPLIRGKGIVMKADHVAMVCPKCSSDVPIVGELAKALSARLLLVFQAPRTP